MRRTPARLAVLVFALGLAAPAIGAIAYVCHPDPAGTQALTLRGQVVGYTVQSTGLVVAVRSHGACTTRAWSAGRKSEPAGVSCAAVAAAPRAATPKDVRIVRPLGQIDRPDRIAVLDASGHITRSWPLPVRVRPHTLQVAGSLAAYSALGGNGLWVTRLTDGRTTFVAPVRGGDRPQLTARGVAYVDNVYKHAPADRPTVKFVPTRSLFQELAQVGSPVYAGGAIRSLSMDGTRVALAVSGGAAGCDRVVFWSIPWRSVEQVSQNAGVTCSALGASRRITRVALGGARAQWITRQNGKAIVVAADDIGCQEWVVSRLSQRSGFSFGGIAADGATLAFALTGRTHSSVELVTGTYRSRDLYGAAATVRSLSAYAAHTAVLWSNGRIDVRTRSGGTLETFAAPTASALALRGNVVVTTTRTGRLDVYSSGKRVHSWPLPVGTRHAVDLQYGIAVVTAGNAVYGLNIANGHTAQLAWTPSAPGAQIGSIGVVYTYGSVARLVPMSRVEEAVR
jgi:hypothetical protein